MSKLIKTKILTSDLEIGMHVIELDRSWLDSDFLMQGFIIQNQAELDALQRQCEFVYIEGTLTTSQPAKNRRQSSQGLTARKPRGDSKKYPETPKSSLTKPLANRKVRYINKVSFREEFSRAQVTFTDAKSVAKGIMEGIRIGRAIDMHEAKSTVDRVVDSILNNKDALIWLSKVKEKDEYTAEHSLNVCILSVTFARFLGHDEGEIRKIGLGALLHDIGKARIPLEVLNKPGRFTDEEFLMMKKHPVFGRNMLMSLPSSDLSAVDVAFSHHERIDGKGYPRQLAAHQISYAAKLVAITDAYDAITSNRCYDKGRASMVALDIIYKNRGAQFDEELALEFIKCIGIYPPGSIVEMTNGEVGIIIEENRDSKLKPKVILVRDEQKNPCRERVVDLHLPDLDGAGKPYAISKEVPDGSYDIFIKEYLANGLLLKRSDN
ncbi:MAG: HD-GYP domain-containing protein [Ketobacteraceae bacterium]|nr:HD-GYP domain-containing protein [Ketobacteraceae bacterium]